jgi:hypothetical protein
MALNLDRITNTFTFTTSSTTAVSVVNDISNVLGWCKTIKLKMPAFASTTPSGTFSILDSDGDTLWTSAVVKQSTTVVITGAEIPLAGGDTIQVTLGAIPSGAATAISVSASVVLTCRPS